MHTHSLLPLSLVVALPPHHDTAAHLCLGCDLRWGFLRRREMSANSRAKYGYVGRGRVRPAVQFLGHFRGHLVLAAATAADATGGRNQLVAAPAEDVALVGPPRGDGAPGSRRRQPSRKAERLVRRRGAAFRVTATGAIAPVGVAACGAAGVPRALVVFYYRCPTVAALLLSDVRGGRGYRVRATRTRGRGDATRDAGATREEARLAERGAIIVAFVVVGRADPAGFVPPAFVTNGVGWWGVCGGCFVKHAIASDLVLQRLPTLC